MTHFASQADYQTPDDVKAAYPSAAKIVDVEGGWMVCDTINDYSTWLGQK